MRFLCFILLSLAIHFLKAQQSAYITIKKADKATGIGSNITLQGNVVCEHAGALLFCDTAVIFRDENRMEATGHIQITKGDSIRVTGRKLKYDGKSKLAVLQNEVKCVEKDMVLTTELLTFDVKNSVAMYPDGGKIVNKNNTLVSKTGYYYSGLKEAAFHQDVVLTNPDYSMRSDTLRYKVPTKTAKFFGPSIIESKQDYIYCENGWYDTDHERAQFSRNSLLVTKQQKMRGDSLFYDRRLKVGKAYRNVSLIDTSHNSMIYGDYVEYHEVSSEALVTRNAIYARVMDDDTLFIGADTLFHRDVDSVHNFLSAYHHVKLFRKNMQASCDSAAYDSRDSLLRMFGEPFLWIKDAQANARVIRVKLTRSQIKSFSMEGRSFMIQDADTIRHKRFNQLYGKKLDGWFVNDTLDKIQLNENVEAIYFVKNKQKTTGLNKTSCSQINAWFKKGNLVRVTLVPKTTGTVDPLSQTDIENARLKGFNWQYAKRPKSRKDLLTHPGK